MRKKVKLLKLSNFTFFHYVFYAICILKSSIATFWLSPAASLNLGGSQNDVLGNGLNWDCVLTLSQTSPGFYLSAVRIF